MVKLLLLLANFARVLALQSPVHHDSINGRGGHLSAFKGLVHDSMHLKGAGLKKEGRRLKLSTSGSESSGKHNVAKTSEADAKPAPVKAPEPAAAQAPEPASAKAPEPAVGKATGAKAAEPPAMVQQRGLKHGRKAAGTAQGALISNEDDVAFVGLQPQVLLQSSASATHDVKAVEALEKTAVVFFPHAWLFFKPTAKIAKMVQCASGIMCVILIFSLCIGQKSPLQLLVSRGKGQPRELDGLLWRARPSAASAEPKQLQEKTEEDSQAADSSPLPRVSLPSLEPLPRVDLSALYQGQQKLEPSPKVFTYSREAAKFTSLAAAGQPCKAA